MDYRLESMAAFTLVGDKHWVDTTEGKNFEIVPAIWRDTTPKRCGEIVSLMEGPPWGLLGVCANMREGGFDYYVAAATQKPAPEGMSTLQVPAATWAVFESVGALPAALQKVWTYIYSEWLPSCDYRHAGLPEMEVYPQGDNRADDYRCEVWIPVVKK